MKSWVEDASRKNQVENKTKMNNRGKASGATWLVVIALIVVAAYGFNAGWFDKETTPVTDPTTPATAQCNSATTPDLDINAYDKENPGTALTEATNLYRKVGGTSWTSFTQGTAITNLEFGERYEVVMGISASDFVDNAYGPYFVTDPIACKESVVLDKAVYNDEVDTSLTATFYNKNHDASAETFIAGATKNVYLSFEAGNDEVYGNPFIKESGLGDNGKHSAEYPNVICMDLNVTAWDRPDQVIYNGVELDSVPTPQMHTGSATDTAYCYEFPVVTDAGVEVAVRLDADDANAPAVDDTATLYAGGFFIDGNGELAWGVETDEGAAVGSDGADTLTMDFT